MEVRRCNYRKTGHTGVSLKIRENPRKMFFSSLDNVFSLRRIQKHVFLRKREMLDESVFFKSLVQFQEKNEKCEKVTQSKEKSSLCCVDMWLTRLGC